MVELDNIRLAKVPIERIIPNPKNPRIPLRKGMPLYDRLYTSIKEHTYLDPIIWNKRTGHIVAGHQRFQVIKDMAEDDGEVLTTIPVVVVDIDESHENTFMIASNRIEGLWDNEKLIEMFENMSEEELGLTGFEDFEIQGLLNGDDVQTFEDDDNTFTRKESYQSVTINCDNENDVDWLISKLGIIGEMKKSYSVSELR